MANGSANAFRIRSGGLRPKGLLGLRKGLLVRFYGEGVVSISKRLYRW